MKPVITAAILFWVGFSAELAWPQTVVRGSLILPLVMAILFWFRDARGIFLAGSCLLIDWVARPTSVPLTAVIVPLLAPVILARAPDSETRRFSRRPGPTIPFALHLPLLTLVGLAIQQISEFSGGDGLSLFGQLAQIPRSMAGPLLTAVPVSAALSLVVILADELGLRHSSRAGRN